jgi:putative DNA primase/helicase
MTEEQLGALEALLPIDEEQLAHAQFHLTETATDMGNGERFVTVLGRHVRYVQDQDRWYVWDGQRLSLDPGRRVFALTQHVITDMRRQADAAQASNDTAERDRWVGHALRSSGVSARKAMMYDGGSRHPVAVVARQLDANPWILGVQNGILELRTGTLRSATVDDLVTKQAATGYDTEAICPLWEGHVRRVCDGDEELIRYLKRAAGYALTGDVTQQKFWFAFGTGQNGKNVFADTLRGMLGEYAQVAPPGLITGSIGQHPTIIADLRGSRMVVVDETGREKMNDARVKMLTGSDRIKARLMKADFFEFENTVKLWILGNTKPHISDATDGIWRRLEPVPFTVRIPDEERILNFTEQLRAEYAGILNWCLEGLWELLEDGLGKAKAVEDARAEYRAEEDTIALWMESCCQVMDVGEDGEVFTPVDDLYASYRSYMVRAGVTASDIPEVRWFGREASLRKFRGELKSVGGRKVRVRFGIRLLGAQLGV